MKGLKQHNSLKTMMRNAFAHILFHLGYFRRRTERIADKAIILMYHRVSAPDGKNGFKMLFGRGVPRPLFETQMDYIYRNLNPVPLREIVRYIQNRQSFPKGAVAITFDDGYEDNYQNAYPVLKRLGIPATIFLTAGYVGEKKIFWWERIGELIKHSKNLPLTIRTLENILRCRIGRDGCGGQLWSLREKDEILNHLIELLKEMNDSALEEAMVALEAGLGTGEQDEERRKMITWEEVREMAQNGVEFGSHTISHSNLATLGEKCLYKEVFESKKIIEENTGNPVLGFAIPYGLKGSYNFGVLEAIKGAGYLYCCTAIPGFVTLDTDVFQLNRISAPNTSLSIFAWKIWKYSR